MYGKPTEQENAMHGEKHFHQEKQGISPSATSHAQRGVATLRIQISRSDRVFGFSKSLMNFQLELIAHFPVRDVPVAIERVLPGL